MVQEQKVKTAKREEQAEAEVPTEVNATTAAVLEDCEGCIADIDAILDEVAEDPDAWLDGPRPVFKAYDDTGTTKHGYLAEFSDDEGDLDWDKYDAAEEEYIRKDTLWHEHRGLSRPVNLCCGRECCT